MKNSEFQMIISFFFGTDCFYYLNYYTYGWYFPIHGEIWEWEFMYKLEENNEFWLEVVFPGISRQKKVLYRDYYMVSMLGGAVWGIRYRDKIIQGWDLGGCVKQYMRGVPDRVATNPPRERAPP